MGTRGFIGIKSNGKISGRYNHFDSYYSSLGKDVLDWYFQDNRVSIELLRLASGFDDGKDDNFLYDGLYCEYGYVYNEDNETLEIYRGFFKTKQKYNSNNFLMHKNYTSSIYYTHIIFVVNYKIHNRQTVEDAFLAFEHSKEDDDEDYPERKIINLCEGCFSPLEVGKKFHNSKCEKLFMINKI